MNLLTIIIKECILKECLDYRIFWAYEHIPDISYIQGQIFVEPKSSVRRLQPAREHKYYTNAKMDLLLLNIAIS